MPLNSVDMTGTQMREIAWLIRILGACRMGGLTYEPTGPAEGKIRQPTTESGFESNEPV
jgi:hypothetical protein